MITSINLSTLPFLGSCDSTRAQMSAKQMQQSLTHPDCEIPYVISKEYRHLTNSSTMGILIAKDDGEVIFNEADLIIIYYKNLDKLDARQLPQIKFCANNFASKLRFSLPAKSRFNKGDIIFSYDSFRNGIPSFGYNVFTAYMPFFGFNHEDGLVISESFANKAKVQFTDTVVIPIYDYSMLQPLYSDVEGSHIYFPNIGQKIRNNVVCNLLEPKGSNSIYNMRDKRQRMMVLLKSFNISDLLNSKSKHLSQFTVNPIKSKIENGTVTGIKIHYLKNDSDLLDKQLEELLKKLYTSYFKDHVTDVFGMLSNQFGNEYTGQILKKFLVNRENPKNPSISNRKDLKEATYLIELEISKEEPSIMGDKFCNR